MTDSLIQNGDSAALRISGRAALMQRIWIQICAHRGAFPYAPELGSSLCCISRDTPRYEQRVLQTVQEAMAALPQVQVQQVRIETDTVTVTVVTEYGSDKVRIPLQGGV